MADARVWLGLKFFFSFSLDYLFMDRLVWDRSKVRFCAVQRLSLMTENTLFPQLQSERQEVSSLPRDGVSGRLRPPADSPAKQIKSS